MLCSQVGLPSLRDSIRDYKRVFSKESITDLNSMLRWLGLKQLKFQWLFNRTWCKNMQFGLEVVTLVVKKDSTTFVNQRNSTRKLVPQFADTMLSSHDGNHTCILNQINRSLNK